MALKKSDIVAAGRAAFSAYPAHCPYKSGWQYDAWMSGFAEAQGEGAHVPEKIVKSKAAVLAEPTRRVNRDAKRKMEAMVATLTRRAQLRKIDNVRVR